MMSRANTRAVSWFCGVQGVVYAYFISHTRKNVDYYVGVYPYPTTADMSKFWRFLNETYDFEKDADIEIAEETGLEARVERMQRSIIERSISNGQIGVPQNYKELWKDDANFLAWYKSTMKI